MMMRRVLLAGLRLTVAAAVVAAAGLGSGCASSSQLVAPQRDPEKARWFNDQALVLIRNDRYDDAEKLLNKSIDADVMFAQARNNLGLVYYHQDKLYLAATEFQNAIRLMPHNPEPRNNLGMVFERAGKFTEAAESYEQARKMEHDNPEYLGNLARAKVRRGDRDEETRRLLEEVVVKDSRPSWRDWARLQIIRMSSSPRPGAATGPAPSADN